MVSRSNTRSVLHLTPEQYEALPPLFQEIILNDKALTYLLEQKVLPFGRTWSLIDTKRRYMRAAKIALHWDNKSRG